MAMDQSHLTMPVWREERMTQNSLFDYHSLVVQRTSDVEPYDEPPAYGFEDGPPSYEAQLTEDDVRQWTLRQEDTGHQRLVATSSSSLASLSIATRLKPRFFSSRPDIEVRIARDPRYFRRDEPRTASVDFDDSGKELPWRPRAMVTVSQATGLTTHKVEMECADLVHWKFDFEGESYAWGLVQSPIFALVLKCIGSRKEVARYTYSEHGSLATQGQDAGTLRINAGAEDDDDSMDFIIQTTCMVTIAYWKKMGRLYRNKRSQSVAIVIQGGRMVVPQQRRDSIFA